MSVFKDPKFERREFFLELLDTFGVPWAIMVLLPATVGLHGWGYWKVFWAYLFVQLAVAGATGRLRRKLAPVEYVEKDKGADYEQLGRALQEYGKSLSKK